MLVKMFKKMLKILLKRIYFETNSQKFRVLISHINPRLEVFSSNEDQYVSLNYKEKIIWFRVRDGSYIDGILASNVLHSKYLIDIISSLVPKNTIYIDVGSNVGSILIPVAAAAPEVEVYGFEPSPLIFKQLKDSCSANPTLNNIQVHNFGLGSRNTILKFFDVGATNGNRGTSSFLKNHDNINGETIDVQVHTLDDFFVKRSRRVSLIKIDVQGFEFDVLQGACDIIKKDRPYVLFEHEDEYHQNASAKRDLIRGFFEDLNYTIFAVDPDAPSVLRMANLSGYVNSNLIAFPKL